MVKIDVLIYTKNNFNNLEKCINAIDAASDYKKFNIKIVVIDDKSSKEERDLFLEKVIKYAAAHTNIDILPIFIGKPVGYIKAMNNGIRHSVSKKYKAALIAFISDRTEIPQNWFETVCAEFENNKNINCISSATDKPLNIDASIFRIDSIKKFDENVLSPLNLPDYYAKQYKKEEIKILDDLKVQTEPETIDETLLKTTDDCIEIKNSFNLKKAYVLYTFIGDSDKLPDFKQFDSKFEHICFTTREKLDLGPNWKIVDVNSIKKGLKLSDSLLKEFIKLNPHMLFTDKTLSIWIDTSRINSISTKNYTDFTYKMNQENFMLCPESTEYDCSYKMLLNRMNQNKITTNLFDKILQIYRWYRLKPGCGMIDTSVLIRKHNDPRCITSMNQIWNYVQTFNQISELFMNFVLYKNKYNYSYIPNRLFFLKYFN